MVFSKHCNKILLTIKHSRLIEKSLVTNCGTSRNKPHTFLGRLPTDFPSDPFRIVHEKLLFIRVCYWRMNALEVKKYLQIEIKSLPILFFFPTTCNKWIL